MKKLLIILGIVIVLIAGAVAVLVANLDKVVDSKKDYILEKAETALGRDVTIGDIGVTLSRGIGVKLSDVAIADDADFSGERFVTAKDLTVRVKLLPLIKKQVEVKRLVLNEPVVNVIRREDGVFNFDSMLSAAASETAGDRVPAGGAASPSPAAASLVLAFADVKNGTVRFVDRAQNVELTVKRIDFTAENAGLGQVASISFAAAVAAEEQNIEVEGTVGPVEGYDTPAALAPTPIQLRASIGPFAVEQFRGVVGDHPVLAQLDPVEMKAVECSLELKGTLGALVLANAEIVSAVLGAEEPNLTIRIESAGPIDATAAGAQEPPDIAFSGRMELKSVALETVKAKLGDAAPPELALGGLASMTADFAGSSKQVDLTTDVDLTAGSVRFGDQFSKPAGVAMAIASKIAVSPTSANIKECTATLGGLVLEASGAIDLGGDSPVLDLSVRSRKADVADIAALLPALQAFSPSGTLELLASAKGALAPGQLPDVEGSVQLEGGGAKLEQMPQPVTGASARVMFTENSARVENGSFTVGRSAVRVAGAAKSLQPLDATYLISSDEAFRTDFNAPPKPSPRPEVLRGVEVEGRLWQEGETVRHDGEASSPSGTLANLDYQNLSATIASTEDRVDIEKYSANTLGGTVAGSGVFLPKATPPRFEVTTHVRKVNLVDYFSYKVSSLPRFIEGTIDLDLDVAGAGKEWTDIQPTLTGKGGAVVIEGSLLNLNIASELLEGLGQVPLVDRSALDRVRSSYPKLFSGNNTAFKDLRGDIRIDGGRIHSKGLVLKSSDFSVFGEGWISMDQTMSLKTNIVFSPQVTQRFIRELSVFKYLTNDRGELEIPVTLSGLVTRPTVAPDIDVLSKKIQDSAVDAGLDKLGDQVGDFLKGFGKKPQAPAKKDTSNTR